METPERPTLLRWALHAAGARLYHQHHCVLELTHQADGGLLFTHGGGSYTLSRSGVWKPRTRILREGVEVLHTVDTGLFQQARIALADGTPYTVAWSNAPLAKLALRDAHGAEVLTLRLATVGGVHTETVLAAGMPLDERALLLLAFAYAQFGGVMRGEGHADDLLLLVS